MTAMVHAADIQDRDGGVLLMTGLFGLFPFLMKLYADGGYQGAQFQRGLKRSMAKVDVEIVKRSPTVQRASSLCLADGSLNAPLLGSTAAAAWPKIGKTSIGAH